VVSLGLVAYVIVQSYLVQNIGESCGIKDLYFFGVLSVVIFSQGSFGISILLRMHLWPRDYERPWCIRDIISLICVGFVVSFIPVGLTIKLLTLAADNDFCTELQEEYRRTVYVFPVIICLNHLYGMISLIYLKYYVVDSNIPPVYSVGVPIGHNEVIESPPPYVA